MELWLVYLSINQVATKLKRFQPSKLSLSMENIQPNENGFDFFGYRPAAIHSYISESKWKKALKFKAAYIIAAP